MTGLELRDVELRLGARVLLRISAVIKPGETLTVMGPSGAGKSALLSFIAGSLSPDFSASGSIWLNGRKLDGLAPEARRVGLLFQDDLLFAHMSVAGNLAFGLPAGGSRATRQAVIEEALGQAGLEGFGARDPGSLSGGQRARVSLLRVLLSQPEALLLDEPFSKLDAVLRAQFRSFVFAQARARGLAVLMVTHDAEDARAAGGPVVELAATEG